MNTIVVDSIVKKFATQIAVNHVSFDVHPGEIFGLLGPNGAGKTTAIRIILDIFKPDSGKVTILGGAMSEDKKNRIGYLPEERGLYQDIPLENCIQYLATLKGLAPAEAKKRAEEFYQRFDLGQHRKKKLKELSKGMQQKAQLISTLIHQPDLIIIDEPFSALDPVNTQMVKDILREERNKGKTIVMCTHQMHQVEELCDRLVLINKGKNILYGTLDEVRRPYIGGEVVVRAKGVDVHSLPGVQSVEDMNGNGLHLHLQPGTSSQDILHTLVEHGAIIDQFEIATPTLDEIFIQVVTQEGAPVE